MDSSLQRDLVYIDKSPSSLSPTTHVQLVESSKRPFGHEIVNTRNDVVSDPMDLVNLARQIETCDQFIRANVSNRLQVIVNQMNFLRDEAQRIMDKAKRDDELNHCACNLVRKPGQIYYYYQRDSGQKYMSIMGPSDWLTSSNKCPHKFLGAYLLEFDNSWTKIATEFDEDIGDNINNRDVKDGRKMIEFLIKS
ncbi:unnamed protein product [Didymodactylos carnosus]|uniref:Uncharacterized protein n=1 Tax=Didymodactylos carnosus TaxID=1234261 RepID=A0A814E7V3_9BILA|nr:unnamed protein product [Didymodactylos carnosus]CAF1163451.1 unnamed protein product [Didymodactylos carnosus]CAF3739090.1 unnamed protein product [Didymodactylos carnosus]CAF3975102.1 unnamed protein product [Didymodactylos carnosus]